MTFGPFSEIVRKTLMMDYVFNFLFTITRAQSIILSFGVSSRVPKLNMPQLNAHFINPCISIKVIPWIERYTEVHL